MPIVYLIGPSGVGKSNAVKLLGSKQPSLKSVDLDQEFPGREFDWSAIEPRLQSLQNGSPEDIIVDVGAGTQSLDQFRNFLLHHRPPILLVMAPPEEIVRRQPYPDRDLGEFRTAEYADRRELYGLATRTVDVGNLPSGQAAEKIVCAILSFFDADKRPRHG